MPYSVVMVLPEIPAPPESEDRTPLRSRWVFGRVDGLTEAQAVSLVALLQVAGKHSRYTFEVAEGS